MINRKKTTDEQGNPQFDPNILGQLKQGFDQSQQPIQPKKDFSNITAPPIQQTAPSIIRDQETGKISGYSLPDGRVIFGNPKDIVGTVNAVNKQFTAPANTTEYSQVQQQQRQANALAQQQAQGQELAQTVGQLTPEQQANIEQTQAQDLSFTGAVKQGVAGSVPKVLSSIGASSGVGAIAGLGAAAAGATAGTIGAAVALPVALGVAATAYSSIRADLKDQAKKGISASSGTYGRSVTNLNKLVTLANKDPARAEEYLNAFNQQIYMIEKAYRQLSLDTQRNNDLFMSEDGIPVLQKFEDFDAPGGAKDILKTKMAIALSNPNPNALDDSLLLTEDLNNQGF